MATIGRPHIKTGATFKGGKAGLFIHKHDHYTPTRGITRQGLVASVRRPLRGAFLSKEGPG